MKSLQPIECISSEIPFEFIKAVLRILLLIAIIFASLGNQSLAQPFTPGAFVTTWKTTQVSEEIKIPINIVVTGYNYSVNWGDGVISTNHSGDATHIYTTPGIYTVSITGNFPAISFGSVASDNINDAKLLTIEQWGTQEWRGMNGGFEGCINLTKESDLDAPIFSAQSTLNAMFKDCTLFNSDLNDWNLTNVRELSRMFENAINFNGNISSWNVANVIGMEYLFNGAEVFNGNIVTWNVSKVERMTDMFRRARLFNQNIGSWDVSKVTQMGAMFAGAVTFNQDISRWKVGSVTNMYAMFMDASSFNQNLGLWDVSKVRNMEELFASASVFNGEIGSWDVSNVTSMRRMFYEAFSFNQAIGGWNVANVTTMEAMFERANSFNKPIGGWNVSKVGKMGWMFQESARFNQDISKWDVSNVKDMYAMFAKSKAFNQDIQMWNVGNVANFSWMFSQAESFDRALGSWNITGATNMTGMLYDSHLSKSNYDATLIGWVLTSGIKRSVSLGANGLQYCTGAEARQKLIDEYGWNIVGDSPACQSMVIFVKKPDGKTLVILSESSDAIQQVKQKVQDKSGIEANQQKLTFNGTTLDDGRTLGDYTILNGSTLNLTLRSNTAPLAVDDAIAVLEDVPAAGNVLTNDTDIEGHALTASLVTAPVNGTVVLNADGSFTYTPNANFVGADSLLYQVCDNGTTMLCDTATVRFTVQGVNDAPIAVDDAIAVLEDVPATGNVLTNDTDIEGHALTASLVTAPVKGTVVLNADGSFTYTPNANFVGADSLLYQVCDNGTPILCDTATVRFTVQGVNDPPLHTVPPAQSVFRNSILTFSDANQNAILISDADLGEEVLRVTLKATSGLLTLGQTTGIVFRQGGNGETSSIEFDGKLSNVNLALNGLKFRPIGNLAQGSLTIVSNDLGATGMGGAKTVTNTLDIDIRDSNPVIKKVSVVNGNGSYKLGDEIEINVEFDQAINVSEGVPTLTLETGTTDRKASFVGRYQSTMTFVYEVEEGDETSDLEYLDVDAMRLEGATIQSPFGENAIIVLPALNSANSIAGPYDIVIDGIRPLVVSVEVPQNGYYKTGNTLDLKVNFSENVNVITTGGTPYLQIAVGAQVVHAAYLGGSGSNVLQFRYTIQDGDEDLDGIAINSQLVLNGGTIQDFAGNETTLFLTQIGNTNGVLVYTKHPTVALSTISTIVNGPFTVVASFSEAVTGFSVSDVNVVGVTVSNLSTTDNITYTFLLTPTIEGDIQISIPENMAVNIADNGNRMSNMLTVQYNKKITGITLEDKSFVYDGIAKSLSIGGTLPNGTSVSYENNTRTDAGSQTVTATVSGANYEDLVLTAELTITKADITGITLEDKSFVYDGTAKSLSIGGTLPSGTSVSYENNTRTDAGSQTVTATVSGANYEDLALTAELTITKSDITGITLEDKSFVYDGIAKSLSIDGTLPSGTSVSYGNNTRTDAGSQTVTATVSGANYEDLVLTAELTITKADITGITLEDKSFVYDGTAKSLSIGGTLPSGTSVSYENNSRTDAGSQTVTATVSGANYEDLVLTAELTITKADITGITFDNKSFVYDGIAKSLSIGGTLPSGTSVSYENNARTDAGSQTVTATVSGANYEDLALTAELTITKAGITGITFENKNFVYDGTAKSLSIGGTLPSGTSVSYENNTRTDAGSQTVRATVSGANYEDLVLTAELKINRAQQIISFAVIQEVYRDEGTLMLDISSNSPLPIKIYSDNILVAEVTGDREVTIKGVGLTKIVAEQEETANYLAAEPVTRELRVRNDDGARLPVRVHPALSPNGDGINDYLRIEGIDEYPENKVTIFDANGILIREIMRYDNQSNNFDGFKESRGVPPGTYFYVMEVKIGEKWHHDKGFFVVRY